MTEESTHRLQKWKKKELPLKSEGSCTADRTDRQTGGVAIVANNSTFSSFCAVKLQLLTIFSQISWNLVTLR